MGHFLFLVLPVFIHSSIEIELMSARYGGSINNNCVKKYDRYTKTLKRCCDGKFDNFSNGETVLHRKNFLSILSYYFHRKIT